MHINGTFQNPGKSLLSHCSLSAVWLMCVWGGTKLKYVTNVQILGKHFSEFCDFLVKVFQKGEQVNGGLVHQSVKKRRQFGFRLGGKYEILTEVAQLGRCTEIASLDVNLIYSGCSVHTLIAQRNHLTKFTRSPNLFLHTVVPALCNKSHLASNWTQPGTLPLFQQEI